MICEITVIKRYVSVINVSMKICAIVVREAFCCDFLMIWFRKCEEKGEKVMMSETFTVAWSGAYDMIKWWKFFDVILCNLKFLGDIIRLM